ncbi:hypothetical protein EZH22_21585 [Xanthobacter dioxanivorans]|uniref:Uncharacterized protein n=1 Tax=Xanthobacter dioxanivorans TaxID=2528964 RepID=A0A974PLA3_9HYPH|nr:hypothetical protein [Xanthobacter dioxanivorans]QRG05624.1 hypothetical protein EZH22_21585 [Xanthobacter dioxanivorans]
MMLPFTVENLPDTLQAGVALGAVILGRVFLTSGFPTDVATGLVQLYGLEAKIALAQIASGKAVTVTPTV